MRIITTIVLFFFICTKLYSTDYFVKNGGNDLSAGTSDGTAWASITKVNSFFSSLVAGDRILFKRGSTFTGRLITNKNGTLANRIVISYYGSGVAPLFSGFTTAVGWTSGGTNLWQSTALSNTNIPWMVTINNKVAQIGRWPNYGYRTFTSHSGDLSITDPTLTGTPNWTGADVVIRKLHDQCSHYFINNHTTNTISYNTTDGYQPINGYGYFVENSLLAVDTANEWFFNNTTKRITVYSLTTPTNVKVSTQDTLVYVKNNYITIDGINFEGANEAAITFGNPSITTTDNFTFKNCNISYSGDYAIFGTRNNNAIIDSNTITYTLSNAIMLQQQGDSSENSTITNNVIKYTGWIPGMWSVNGNAITVIGDKHLIQYNRIDTVGHIGIAYYYDSVRVLNNYINYYCSVGGDAGAINTFDLTFGARQEKGREVKYNIVLNGAAGESIGTTSSQDEVMGIYADDKANGIDIEYNFVANTRYAGIYMHNVTDIKINYNTVYNAVLSQIQFRHDDHAIGIPIRNIQMKSNLFFANTSAQKFNTILTRDNCIGCIFTSIDSQRYARPILITGVTIPTISNYGISNKDTNYTVTTWKAKYPTYDVNSTEMGSNTNATSYIYNATNSPATTTFTGYSYVDPYGNIYNNSALLSAWTGKILIYNGTVPPPNKFPVANAGANISITLPVSSTNIIGTGSDSDGVIISYAWAQLSGPNTAVISPTFSTTTGTTNVSGLIEGIYFFQLTVTDNSGDIGTSTMRVTVNAAIPNTPPTANAGVDKTITLPVTTTSVTGSGTNGSGTSRTYLWSVISQPPTASATFGSSTSATTTINNLTIAGTYAIQLKVTNNLLDSAIDDMQVTVLPLVPPANEPPVANAGSNITITLPLDSTSVNGNGSTDSDGTIVSYEWIQLSGPSTATLSTPDSVYTKVLGLMQGVYSLQLKVKDNNGDSSVNAIQITVNAAPMQTPPTAIAGNDQVIYLPLDFVNLSGSGINGTNVIGCKLWTKFSGPNSPTITNDISYATSVTGLIEGTYLFQLQVVDSEGLTGVDLVQIVVRAAVIRIPVLIRGYRIY